VLSYASFAGMRLQDLSVIDCHAHESISSRAPTSATRSSPETDLRGARFNGADLSEASAYAIDAALTKLKGTKMSFDGALETARLLGMEV